MPERLRNPIDTEPTPVAGPVGKARRGTRIALAGGSALGLAAAAIVALTSAGTADAALTTNWYASAPYVMPLDNNPPDVNAVMAASGQKAFQLAFILAPNGGGCSPTWDGTAAVSSDTAVANIIAGIRANGGDVSVSTGGYGGTKLGQTCGTAAATASAYQQVITKYALKAIDLDLEEPEYENTAAIDNEIGAAKILAANNPGLYVSITVPGTTSGTGYFGQNVLNTAKNQGFTPANFSIMPFDGGFNGSASQISALESFHSMLTATFGWDSATAYHHEGVSMMNGRSDTGEIFTQTDFQNVLNYATSHGLARYTYWSVNRDRQCSPPDNNGTTSGTCSSVAQGAWDFTKFTTQFAGATPPTIIPTTTPTTTPPTGACTAAAWSPTQVYTNGMKASEGGHQYTAKWWTQNEDPATHHGVNDVWTDNGTCSGGGTATPTPTPTPTPTATPTPTPTPTPTQTGQYPAWVANHAYAVGDRVSYAGHNYQCRQAHTSQVGWEPPNVPALWLAI